MPWAATTGCDRELRRTSPLLSCAMCLNSFLRALVTFHSQVELQSAHSACPPISKYRHPGRSHGLPQRSRRLHAALAWCLILGAGTCSRRLREQHPAGDVARWRARRALQARARHPELRLSQIESASGTSARKPTSSAPPSAVCQPASPRPRPRAAAAKGRKNQSAARHTAHDRLAIGVRPRCHSVCVLSVRSARCATRSL
jgi:hypothetical protein